jgi:hypothetical protein
MLLSRIYPTKSSQKKGLLEIEKAKNRPEKFRDSNIDRLGKGSGMEVYSVKDLSEQLHASQKAIRSYLKTGKLRGKKVFRKWLVSEDALRELLGVGVKQHAKKG